MGRGSDGKHNLPLLHTTPTTVFFNRLQWQSRLEDPTHDEWKATVSDKGTLKWVGHVVIVTFKTGANQSLANLDVLKHPADSSWIKFDNLRFLIWSVDF